MKSTLKTFEITWVENKDKANSIYAKINIELKAQLSDESDEIRLWTEEKFAIY